MTGHSSTKGSTQSPKRRVSNSRQQVNQKRRLVSPSPANSLQDRTLDNNISIKVDPINTTISTSLPKDMKASTGMRDQNSLNQSNQQRLAIQDYKQKTDSSSTRSLSKQKNTSRTTASPDSTRFVQTTITFPLSNLQYHQNSKGATNHQADNISKANHNEHNTTASSDMISATSTRILRQCSIDVSRDGVGITKER